MPDTSPPLPAGPPPAVDHEAEAIKDVAVALAKFWCNDDLGEEFTEAAKVAIAAVRPHLAAGVREECARLAEQYQAIAWPFEGDQADVDVPFADLLRQGGDTDGDGNA